MKLPRLLLIPSTLLLAAHLSSFGAASAPRKKTPPSQPGHSKSARSNAGTKKGSGKRGRRSRVAAPRGQLNPTPERVLEIQKALSDRGYSVPVTGAWGPESEQALKKFQSDQNLPARGKLDSLSLISLGLGPRREPAPVTPPQERD